MREKLIQPKIQKSGDNLINISLIKLNLKQTDLILEPRFDLKIKILNRLTLY